MNGFGGQIKRSRMDTWRVVSWEVGESNPVLGTNVCGGSLYVTASRCA
jgi:hypothetical protein